MLLLLILVSGTVMAVSEMRVSPNTTVLMNKTWVPASQLKPGDTFITPDGKKAIVRVVEDVITSENTSCYGYLTTRSTTAPKECSPTLANMTPSPGAEATGSRPQNRSLLEILLATWHRLLNRLKSAT